MMLRVSRLASVERRGQVELCKKKGSTVKKGEEKGREEGKKGR